MNLQRAPLNGFTLGQTITDSIKQNENNNLTYFPYKVRYLVTFSAYSIWLQFEPINRLIPWTVISWSGALCNESILFIESDAKMTQNCKNDAKKLQNKNSNELYNEWVCLNITKKLLPKKSGFTRHGGLDNQDLWSQ
jgi:hypothetical protein